MGPFGDDQGRAESFFNLLFDHFLGPLFQIPGVHRSDTLNPQYLGPAG